MIITEFMENGALDAFLRVRAEDQLGRGMHYKALGIDSWSGKKQPCPFPNLPLPLHLAAGAGGPAGPCAVGGHAAGHCIWYDLPQ